MGASSSSEQREVPDPLFDATLYYFGGRGLADQIRWVLAATSVSFTQKVIRDRATFVSMAKGQLPFGQLPLLQIDKMEIVESQACEYSAAVRRVFILFLQTQAFFVGFLHHLWS